MTPGAPGDPLILAVQAGLPGPGRYGLAVSGGGDSMALLHLCAAAGIAAEVATVDHRLRPEAADEAVMVAGQAADLGFAHEVLIWDGPSARGNLADAGRLARRHLLGTWAQRRGLQAVVLAHTLDDVAETFLMRLARGAGVDGLSAMAPAFQAEGASFLRPLLGVSRAALRDWLTARKIGWAEDPTNADPAYDRTRARAALAALAPLGLTAARLADVAGNLSQARQALEGAARDLFARVVTEEDGGLRLETPVLLAAPEDLQRRVVVMILHRVAPAPYAPRGEKVTRLLDALRRGAAAQLGGVRFVHRKGALWAGPEKPREPGA